MPLVTLAAGIEVYRFASLDADPRLVHFVSTRGGGVSRPPFAGLNLGDGVGDDPAAVATNRARLTSALGVAASRLVTCRQVHGSAVHVVPAVGRSGAADAAASAGASSDIPTADALVTAAAGVCLAVLVADCVPIVLFDPRTPAVGVAHAGWRGTVAGVAAQTVGAMTAAFGTRPGDLVAGIGPSIGPADYVVGPEVAAAFRRAFPRDARDVVRDADGDRCRVDLWQANVRQLEAAGVAPDRIAVAGISTAASTDRFFSHRAEAGRTGRFAAGAMLR
ncbi:peptidoglycan editing factor PgeF [bacterium]|nr:MAG: peptidoglycan editing factor PgeF [bacterium]